LVDLLLSKFFFADLDYATNKGKKPTNLFSIDI